MDTTPDFFISRAGASETAATYIAQIIRDAGQVPFLQDQFGNASFMAKIEQGLIECPRMIALLCRAYQGSEYCQKEYGTALTRDPNNLANKLIIFRIEDVKPHGLLDNLTYFDLVPALNDAPLLHRLVRAALGFDTSPEDVSFLNAFRRDRRVVRHHEFRETPGFTGRDTLLTAIDTKLAAGSTAIAIRNSGEARLAVHGIGGVGKTVLAREYGWRRAGNYTGLWWLRAQTAETLAEDLIQLGERIGLAVRPPPGSRETPAEAAQSVLQSLAGTPSEKPWLLVYDNVEDRALVSEFTPRENAHVLVTSRLSEWRGVAEDVPVDVFEPEVAADYLLEGQPGETRAAALALAKTLHRLPLALDHALAYCRLTGLSFADYGARLPQLIDEAPLDRAGEKSVYATFALAMEAAARTSPDVERLIEVLAWLDADGIPGWLVPEEVLSFTDMNRAIAALKEVSLIRIDQLESGERAFSLHRLVQQVMGLRLEAAGRADAARALTARLVEQSYLDAPSLDTLARNREWAPQAAAVLDHAPRTGAAAYSTLWTLFQLGDFQTMTGALGAALKSYQQGEALARQLSAACPSDDPTRTGWQRDLSVSLERVGDVLKAQGQLSDALERFEESRKIFARLAEADPGNAGWQRDLSVSLNKVGDVLKAQGQLSAALERFED
ncbi:MAG: TIR domain-containing protein, partial [Pseudomonadota bacterium]